MGLQVTLRYIYISLKVTMTEIGFSNFETVNSSTHIIMVRNYGNMCVTIYYCYDYMCSNSVRSI